MIKTFQKHWFVVMASLIIALAIFLRFVNYENRWGIAYDQARDALVISEIVRTGNFPLIGPFSASGPFVFGPLWYWVFALVSAAAPAIIIVPWVFQGILYVLIVIFMLFIGTRLENKQFGLLLALFTSVSTTQLAQSTNLTYSSFVGVIATISMYLFISYIRQKKAFQFVLLAFCLGVAVNVHFQAIGLLVMLPIAFVLGGWHIKHALFSVPGFLIPYIPIVIFDFTNDHFQSRNLYEYFFASEDKAYLPKRWLTYVTVFWPMVWSRIIGGNIVISYAIIGLLSLVTMLAFLKRQVPKEIIGIIAVFLINFVSLRYFKGQTFEAFLTFLHPTVLILSAWMCYRVIIFRRFIGVVLVAIIVIGSLVADFTEIASATNFTARGAEEWRSVVVGRYPDKTFAVYDYKYESAGKSLPFVLFMNSQKKVSDDGMKIGVVATEAAYLEYSLVYSEGKSYQIVDLSILNETELEKTGWVFVNPGAVYHSVVEWYKK